MVELSQGRKEYRIFHSIPGIGDSMAFRLIGEIGNIHRFQSAKQLNAYAGIDIIRYQSDNTSYRDCINKRENKHLRNFFIFHGIRHAYGKRKT